MWIPGAGPHVIAPATTLPIITQPVAIDGYSEPDAVKGTNPAPGPINAAPSVVIGPATQLAHGLRIEGDDVTVRGLVIQNASRGVFVRFADRTTLEGNFIGTDATGLVSMENVTGVEAVGNVSLGGADLRIGGVIPEARNLISGNRTNGVLTGTTDRCIIEGNLIGVDATGVSALPNGSRGIMLSDSDDCRIGGGAAGAGNVVAGNVADQIVITGGVSTAASLRTVVQGNFLGTDPGGTVDLGGSFGLSWVFAADSLIGGTGPGEGNLIAFNNAGVSTPSNSGPTDSGNRVLGNRIWANELPPGNGLGIDLRGNGVTLNDHCDPDTGTNGLQNFPVLTALTSLPGGVTIDGELDSAPVLDPNVPDPRYLIEFFASSTCDPSGYGEGEFFLGRMLIGPPDPVTCLSPFSVFIPTPVTAGWVMTATATDPFGSTSEFSACLAVPPVITPSGAVPDGGRVPGVPLSVTLETGGDITLSWDASCLATDTDYEVYEGTVGAYYSHVPLMCSTGGLTTATFTPSPASAYYLVVPTSGTAEGSYGVDSGLVERPPQPGACRPQLLDLACP